MTRFAFVSACYSEKLGRVFIECGVPIVIAINQEEKVLDAAGGGIAPHTTAKVYSAGVYSGSCAY